MSKSKAKLIAMTFIIFVISIFFINSNFATQINNEEVTDWKVSITSDTKDLKDTQEISFLHKKIEQLNIRFMKKLENGNIKIRYIGLYIMENYQME